jgi:mRNA interferase RelE/StbE
MRVRASVRPSGISTPECAKDVLAKMRALSVDPRPPGTEALRGYSPWMRVRVGDYRIVYVVDDEALVVTIGTVGHRREVYRHLDL